MHQGVYHHVSNELNTVTRQTLSQQILARFPRRCEQESGEPIRKNSIDFFRHAPVPASQTRLDVANTDAELRRN